MPGNAFDILIFIARPAAGKSEIMDYLRHTDVDSRDKRFHIGKFEEIDDFPMLWVWFEEDAILAEMGKPRLHTTDGIDFKANYMWDVLVRRMCLEYNKRLRADASYHKRYTTLIKWH